MGITDGKLLYCHGVSEGDVDNKVKSRYPKGEGGCKDVIISKNLGGNTE